LRRAKQVHDLQRQIRVEVAGRLVRDQQRRTRRDRAGDADALLLAGRQHDRRQVFLAEQADLVERRAHPPARLAAARPGDDQRQGDVVEHGAIAEQLVILEHHPDLAPERRHLAPRDPRGVASPDQHLPPGRALDAGDQLQQGALARAGVPGQERHLAGVDAETQVAQGVPSRRDSAC
jgi:hypothetical protein